MIFNLLVVEYIQPMSDFFSTVPNLMQGLTMAIVTIQIPLGIGLFENYFRKRQEDNPGGEFKLLEFMDKTWKFKEVVILTLLSFTITFFFFSNILIINIILLIVWILITIRLADSLKRLYIGVKRENKNSQILNNFSEAITENDYSLQYLSQKKNVTDSVAAWRSFWGKEIEGTPSDEEFFKVFALQVDENLKTKKIENIRMALALLDDFYKEFEHRSDFFVTMSEAFLSQVFEWHHSSWHRWRTLMDTKEKGFTEYFQISNVIKGIIQKITEQSLSNFYYSYFTVLEKHLEKYKDDVVQFKKRELVYIESIPIYNDLLELIPESDQSSEIWNTFPFEWKTTIENNKNYIQSRVWLNIFLNWVPSRIRGGEKEKWDKKLEDAGRELFPEVSPPIWSRIITFIFLPYGDSRMESIIENKRNFGLIGRIISTNGDEDIDQKFRDSSKDQKEKTIELCLTFFGNIFTKENIELWRKEINILKYEEDSREFQEKELWVKLFKNILIEKDKKVTG
jgi:hypothetical protein